MVEKEKDGLCDGFGGMSIVEWYEGWRESVTGAERE
jgi:hypothetical protein